MIGEDGGISGDWGRVKWSRFTTSRIDTKRMEAENPDLVKGYRTERPADRISPKWEK